jgi:L-rhamnonate dehydratase
VSTCRDALLFEDCVDDSPLRRELTIETVQARDGWIAVPDGPGLGVTLNEDFVSKITVAESK